MDQLFEDINEIERTVTDLILCPVLATLFPPEGDIVVGGEKLFDCPPYDVDPPSDDSPSGALCGLSSSNDVVAAGEMQRGQVEGGPLAAGGSIQVVCSVQVGASAQFASAPDAVTAASSTGSGIATLPPQVVTFVATGEPVYVCSSAVVNGSSLHYDYGSGQWTTSAATARCWQAYSQTVDPTPLTPADDDRATYNSPPWMVGCADFDSGAACV